MPAHMGGLQTERILSLVLVSFPDPLFATADIFLYISQ